MYKLALYQDKNAITDVDTLKKQRIYDIIISPINKNTYGGKSE